MTYLDYLKKNFIGWSIASLVCIGIQYFKDPTSISAGFFIYFPIAFIFVSSSVAYFLDGVRAHFFK